MYKFLSEEIQDDIKILHYEVNKYSLLPIEEKSIYPPHIKLDFILVSTGELNYRIFVIRKRIGEAVNKIISSDLYGIDTWKFTTEDLKIINDVLKIISLYRLGNFISPENQNILHEISIERKYSETICEIFDLFEKHENINKEISSFNTMTQEFIDSIDYIETHEPVIAIKKFSKCDNAKNMIFFCLLQKLFFYEKSKKDYSFSQILMIDALEEYLPKRSIELETLGLLEPVKSIFHSITNFLKFDVSVVRFASEFICNCVFYLDSKFPLSARYFVPKIIKQKVIEQQELGLKEISVVSIGSGRCGQEAILLEALKNDSKTRDVKIKLSIIDPIYFTNGKFSFISKDTTSLCTFLSKYNKSDFFENCEIFVFQNFEQYESFFNNKNSFLPTIIYAVDVVEKNGDAILRECISEKHLINEVLEKSINPFNLCCIYTLKAFSEDYSTKNSRFTVEYKDLTKDKKQITLN